MTRQKNQSYNEKAIIRRSLHSRSYLRNEKPNSGLKSYNHCMKMIASWQNKYWWMDTYLKRKKNRFHESTQKPNTNIMQVICSTYHHEKGAVQWQLYLLHGLLFITLLLIFTEFLILINRKAINIGLLIQTRLPLKTAAISFHFYAILMNHYIKAFR